MPRRSRGPRLYLRRGRTDARTQRQLPDLYYIRDGARELGTGCGPERLREAERALSDYIAEKWTAPRATAGRSPGDPAQVLVADALALYAAERAPQLSDPVSTAGRIETLLAWWGERPLSEVTRSTCRAYVEHRTQQHRKTAKSVEARKRTITPQGARRELEDLSAAIGYWDGEHHLLPRPKVLMPDKRPSPRDALTRAQAAAMLKAARGWRLTQDGWERLPLLTRKRRAHMPRLLLIDLYTGTRPGVTKKLLWEESPLQAWIDLDRGMIYRRGRAERDTNKRRPVAKLPGRLRAHLARWKRLDAERGRKAAEAARAAGEPIPAPIASVIHYAGVPVVSVRGSFAAVTSDAGLSPEITPHWLRHTAATWLMEAGEEPWAAAAYMGMTMETLERHYGHHRPDFQAAVSASRRRSNSS